MRDTNALAWLQSAQNRAQTEDIATLKANKAIEATITPTYINSWVEDTAGTGYFKDDLGFVHFVGTIKSGSTAAAAFILPLGYRPLRNLKIPTINAGTGFGILQILASGQVWAGNATITSLEGISFLAGR